MVGGKTYWLNKGLGETGANIGKVCAQTLFWWLNTPKGPWEIVCKEGENIFHGLGATGGEKGALFRGVFSRTEGVSMLGAPL